jgi:hypothetical protein
MRAPAAPALLSVFALPSGAEGSPVGFAGSAPRLPCALDSVVIDWDFNQGYEGFVQTPCDEGAVPVWNPG